MKKIITLLLAVFITNAVWSQTSLPDTDPSTITPGISYKSGPGTSGGWNYNYGVKLRVWSSLHRNFEVMNTNKDGNSTLAFRTYNGEEGLWTNWREFLFRDANDHLKLSVKNFYKKSQSDFDGDLFLLSSNSAAKGNFGGSISFSRVSGDGGKRASIVAKQTGNDNDHVGLSFFTHGNTAADDLIESMVIDGVGKVGIGISEPIHTLDVNGQGRFTESLILGADSNGGLNFGNSWNAYSNTDNDSYIVTHSGSGGAEMEIKNVDGDVNNSVTIFKSKVGIGVGTPNEKLEINGKIGLHSNGDIYQLGSSSNSTTGISVRSLTNPVNGDNLFTVESAGSGSRLGVTQAHGAWITDGLRIGTQFNSSMPDLESGLIVSGKVAFGTTSVPEEFDFALDGKAIMEEVKVELSESWWPDYVFESDYPLRTLKETEEFIKENKHLPEIPSAKEVEENGIYLGEMNALLLKKIEELTLYVLELEKRNIKQDALIDEILKKVDHD